MRKLWALYTLRGVDGDRATMPDAIFQKCLRGVDVNSVRDFLDDSRLSEAPTFTEDQASALRVQSADGYNHGYYRFLALVGEQVSSRIDFNADLIPQALPAKYRSLLKAVVHAFCIYPKINYKPEAEEPYGELWNKATGLGWHPYVEETFASLGNVRLNAPVAEVADILVGSGVMRVRNRAENPYMYLTKSIDPLLRYKL